MYSYKILITASLLLTELSSHGQVSQQKDTLKVNSKEFVRVEIEAGYPGGNDAWKKFLEKNLKSGVPADNNAPVGRYQAAVMFIVDTDGSVSNVTPATKFGYGMEEELIRVIEHSGKWTPASQNGKPVKAFRKQPVTFVIESGDFKIETQEPYTLFTNMDNEITVSARKIKATDISINVPGGKVTPVSNGKFIVRVSKPGRVNIEIVNSKKNDKEIGIASFEVRVN